MRRTHNFVVIMIELPTGEIIAEISIRLSLPSSLHLTRARAATLTAWFLDRLLESVGGLRVATRPLLCRKAIVSLDMALEPH